MFRSALQFFWILPVAILCHADVVVLNPLSGVLPSRVIHIELLMNNTYIRDIRLDTDGNYVEYFDPDDTITEARVCLDPAGAPEYVSPAIPDVLL